ALLRGDGLAEPARREPRGPVLLVGEPLRLERLDDLPDGAGLVERELVEVRVHLDPEPAHRRLDVGEDGLFGGLLKNTNVIQHYQLCTISINKIKCYINDVLSYISIIRKEIRHRKGVRMVKIEGSLRHTR